MPLPGFIEVLAIGFSFVFPCWPFLLLTPLSIRRRRNIPRNMLFGWGFLAAIRGFLIVFPPPQIPFIIIPEPLSTILFLITGAVLIVILCSRSIWTRTKLRRKVEQANTINDLLELSPREFENLIVEVYRLFGHQAKRTGSIGDHGVDVTIKTKGGEKHVVQCKRWRSNVGEPIIRDFYGAMQHEKADKGIIITTADFTPQAQEWAKGKPLSLINGSQLLKVLKQAREKRSKAAEN